MHQKKWMGQSLNKFTEGKIFSALAQLGQSLPCSVAAVSGSIVTVNFEIETGYPWTLPKIDVPLFGPEYIRYPIQVGDKGVVFAADARLGAMSGMSTVNADLMPPAPLTALVFFPIGNKAWGTVDPNAVTIYGPNGVVLRNTGSDTVMTLTPGGISVICSDSFTISTVSCSFSLASDGTYSISGNTCTITDSVAHTSPAIMNAAWTALVTWLNAHAHTSATPGNPTSVPIVPFTGSNIAP